MSEERISHFKSLGMTFFPGFYRNIVHQSFGRTFVYVMFLSFVVAFLLSAKYTIVLNSFLKEAAVKIKDVWPQDLTEIQIKNGQVSSPVAQPFTYKFSDFTLVLDTTGKVTTLDEYKEGVLIANNKILFKTKKSEFETETREYNLSKVESLVIRRADPSTGQIARIITRSKTIDLDHKLLNSWLRIFRPIIFSVILLWLFLYYLNAKIFQAVIFSLLALMVNRMAKAGLPYKKLLNLCVYALTPATLVALLFLLANMNVRSFWLMFCLLYSIYLIYVIKSNKINLETPQDVTPE